MGNYEACQKKKEYKKMGKKLPFCTDGTVAKCPSGYESYSKNPPCVSADGSENVKPVCEDLSNAIDCKRKKNKNKPACALGAKKSKRWMCPDQSKATCPAGYSKGECLNEVTGERKKSKCSHDGTKEKPVKCFKEENQGLEVCAGTTAPMCESTMSPPTCPEGFNFDLTPYKKDITDDTTPAALVLKAGRPHGPGPRGRGEGPRRPPFGKGPKGEISVDFLCLKVD